jgi:glycosyltransferase involved in cell wall biosynthesis
VTSLRVAAFVDQFPELSETFISSELQALRASGHAVTVEAGRRASTPDDAAAEGLDVAYLDSEGHRRRLRALAWLLARHPAGVLRDVIARRRWCREEHVRPLRQLAPAAQRAARRGAEHLHAHFAAGAALDAMRVGALLGIPYSLATHGYDIFMLPANLREKHERAAFAVSASDYSVRHLRGVVGDEAGARIHRLVMGVDGDRFRRTAPYPGGGTVVAIGRLVEKKGMAYLIEAAAALGDTSPLERVMIAGDGPLRPELEKLIAGSGAPVELLGWRSPDEIRGLLERADLLAMPCVVAADGDRDTMPVVVKEALAMEVPVVATDEVGLPEVVRPEWGRLVPPRDSEALATAIESVLALPVDDRAAMGRAGRAYVLEHCDVGREAERLVSLIQGGDRLR